MVSMKNKYTELGLLLIKIVEERKTERLDLTGGLLSLELIKATQPAREQQLYCDFSLLKGHLLTSVQGNRTHTATSPDCAFTFTFVIKFDFYPQNWSD